MDIDEILKGSHHYLNSAVIWSPSYPCTDNSNRFAVSKDLAFFERKSNWVVKLCIYFYFYVCDWVDWLLDWLIDWIMFRTSLQNILNIGLPGTDGNARTASLTSPEIRFFSTSFMILVGTGFYLDRFNYFVGWLV